MFPSESYTFLETDGVYFGDNLGIPLPHEGCEPSVFEFEPYKITFSLIVFCRKGEMSVTIGGVNYYLKKDSTMMMIAGSIIEKCTYSHDCHAIIIGFDYAKASTEMEIRTSSEFVRYQIQNPNPVSYDLSAEEALDLEGLYVSCRNMLKAEKHADLQKEIMAGLMNIVFSCLIRWRRGEAKQASPKEVMTRDQRILERFFADIKRYSSEERAVAFYAKQQNLTPKYFSRVVMTMTGKRPLQMIQEYVILEAKCLLRTGRYTVKEVSDRLGFSNQSFFSKYFHKFAGVTPMEYQRES